MYNGLIIFFKKNWNLISKQREKVAFSPEPLLAKATDGADLGRYFRNNFVHCQFCSASVVFIYILENKSNSGAIMKIK